MASLVTAHTDGISSHRTTSSGSGLSDYNSMERAAASGAEKRKKDSASGSRFDATRVDAEDVINDLLQNADFDNPDESAESESRQGRRRRGGRGGRDPPLLKTPGRSPEIWTFQYI